MRRCSRGFTLIELMLVLAVIGVMYAVVFMRLDHVFSRYRLRGDARDLLAAMELARSQAVSQQHPFRIVLDLNGGAFWLERGEDREQSEVSAPPSVRSLGHGIRFERVAISGRNFRSGKAAIEYDPMGCASACEVRLTSDDGRKIRIEVNPLHGYARVQE